MAGEDQQPILLLIDDSEDVHRLIKARLRSEGLQLVSAMGGEDGLQHAQANVPSVILLDLDMPGMDGFSVLRAMKNCPALRAVPVIVLSGLSASDDKVTAFDLGATDYVTKPFDFAELRARVRAALRLDRLLKMLAERADIDGLTGLANRAAFDKRWGQEAAQNRRYGKPLSLAVFDLDHFKRINDTYGHPAGDEVLQGFAKIVRACCREVDIPCRFGGEEFVLIMPNTAPADAHTVVQRIREAVAATTWPRHPTHQVTVSIGVAGGEAACEATPEQWVECADKALYSAKRGGRNRVVLGSLTEAKAA